MKWNKAIQMIETALAEGKTVEIEYHRKWCRNANEVRWAVVESVTTYDWNGKALKAVNMSMNMVEEGNWMITKVNVEDPEEIHKVNGQLADEEIKLLEAEGIIKVKKGE